MYDHTTAIPEQAAAFSLLWFRELDLASTHDRTCRAVEYGAFFVGTMGPDVIGGGAT